MIKIFCDRCGKECVGKKSSDCVQINGGHSLDAVVCADCSNKIKEFMNMKEDEGMRNIKTICDLCGKEIKSQMLTAKKTYVSESYPISINGEIIVEDCCDLCMKDLIYHIGKMKVVK